MAQILALLSLLKKLVLKELSSSSSVRFNNFLFCILFIMSAGGGLKVQFLSTFFFQIVLLAPLLVTFSVDTLHRLPPERVATWPLTGTQTLLLSSVSFALNPLFIVLFFGYLFWMGLAAALFFVLLALIAQVWNETFASAWSAGHCNSQRAHYVLGALGHGFLTAIDTAAFQKNAEYSPVYPWCRVVALVETLLTSVLGGLFLLAVRRQFRI